MKFTVEKAILMQAVNAVSRTVTARTSIPALEGILFEASSASVTLTGYNLSTGIRAVFDAAVQEPGSIVIGARLISDIIRKCSDPVFTISSDDRLTVGVKNGMSEFTLLGIAGSEYPALPETENDNTLKIEQRVLKSMLAMTTFAVSDNDNKPIHTGALFDIKDGNLTIVAVDGYRLAIRREPVESTAEAFKFVVPGAALRECERLLEDSDNMVTLSLGARHITFDLGDTTLISRLLEGEFLNYETAIPKEFKYTMTLDVAETVSAVERVSLIISERLKNPVCCLFGGETLNIWCQTALGRAQTEVAVEGDGGDTEIGFNHRYMLDALNAVPDENVRVELSSGLSPCVLRPVESDAYLFMILPVRLR